jgi:hypothetical protein
MLPEAYLTHLTPGRLRVKIPSKKGDGSYFLSLKERFAHFPGVEKIEVNPLTGSLLVLHNLDLQNIDRKALSDYTEMSGLFKLQFVSNPPDSASDTIHKTYWEANEKVKRFTDGQIDLPVLAFTGLLGAGMIDMGRGNLAAPAWHVAFWYALNIFLQGQSARAKQELHHQMQGEV